MLDDNDASLRYGSEHDESEKRLSIIISSSCPHFTKPSSFWKRTMTEDTWNGMRLQSCLEWFKIL